MKRCTFSTEFSASNDFLIKSVCSGVICAAFYSKKDALQHSTPSSRPGGRQIRQGGRVPDQGSRRAARLLRLPGRALEAPAHDERHRLFATVRHRTVRSKGCLSNKTALAMIFKLAEAVEKSWHRLKGHNQLPKIILGIKFTDGIEVVRLQAQTAA
jgi:hypothetical protein